MKLLPCIMLAVVLYTLSGCHSSDQSSAKQSADSTYTLTGKITGADTGWVYLLHRSMDPSITDSVKMDGGRFTFSGKAKGPEFCLLGIPDNGQASFRLSFFLDTGLIRISGSKDSLNLATITGSRVQDEYKNFLAELKPMEERERKLGKLYDSLEAKGQKVNMDSIQKTFGQIEKDKKELAKAYARKHPASIVAAFEVYDNFFLEPDAGELDTVYHGLDTGLQNSYYGKKIKNVLEKTKMTAVGNPAPEFTQNDVSDKPVALSSFRGKYLLIDFWASWCGPCRAENPNVLKAYHQYNPKGFDILGVSLDDKKDKWEQAIQKDHLTWTQVSDLKGWKNSAAEQYGINAIPMNFLLDKNGKIIARGLRGEELEKKLHEVLN